MYKNGWKNLVNFQLWKKMLFIIQLHGYVVQDLLKEFTKRSDETANIFIAL